MLLLQIFIVSVPLIKFDTILLLIFFTSFLEQKWKTLMIYCGIFLR
jgi:hypothetical protein